MNCGDLILAVLPFCTEKKYIDVLICFVICFGGNAFAALIIFTGNPFFLFFFMCDVLIPTRSHGKEVNTKEFCINQGLCPTLLDSKQAIKDCGQSHDLSLNIVGIHMKYSAQSPRNYIHIGLMIFMSTMPVISADAGSSLLYMCARCKARVWRSWRWMNFIIFSFVNHN